MVIRGKVGGRFVSDPGSERGVYVVRVEHKGVHMWSELSSPDFETADSHG